MKRSLYALASALIFSTSALAMNHGNMHHGAMHHADVENHGIAICTNADQTLQLSDSWVRAPFPGAKMTGAFFRISNCSDQAITLTGAISNIAKATELHHHTMDNGMMRMRQLDQLVIEKGQSRVFQPGGLHVMFLGLIKDLNEGDQVTINLVDSQSKHYPISIEVKSQ